MLVRRIFDQKFKEEGRYQYGLELGRMADKDGLEYEGRDGRKADTIELVMKKLFNTIVLDTLYPRIRVSTRMRVPIKIWCPLTSTRLAGRQARRNQ